MRAPTGWYLSCCGETTFALSRCRTAPSSSMLMASVASSRQPAGARMPDILRHVAGGPCSTECDRGFKNAAIPLFLQAWKEGQTGFPFVDANMRELAATGFMSNRGRQNVASFLTKVRAAPFGCAILKKSLTLTVGFRWHFRTSCLTGDWALNGSSPCSSTTTWPQITVCQRCAMTCIPCLGSLCLYFGAQRQLELCCRHWQRSTRGAAF